MKKLVLLILTTILLLPLAACRDLTELQHSFDSQQFVPNGAQIINSSDGMLLFDLHTHDPETAFANLLETYEETLYFLQGWQETSREDGEEGFLVITGTYGENENTLTITMRQGEHVIRVLLGFADEVR